MFSSFNFSKLNKAERRAIRHCTSIDEQLQRKLKGKKKKRKKEKEKKESRRRRRVAERGLRKKKF